MHQEIMDRSQRRVAIGFGLQSLREQRYEDAIAAVEPCLEGPDRLLALRIKMRAMVRIDRAASEGVIRELIAEGADDAETAKNLEAALVIRRRNESRLAREKKDADREAVHEGLRLLREQRYEDALATVEPATEGALRLKALHIKMRALKRTDLASAEPVVRALIEEGVETDEVKSNLASSLVAKQRKELREAREKKTADRDSLRQAMTDVREGRFDEALALIEPALDGAFRPLALRLKMNALMRSDRAAAEDTIRDLIEIEGETEALQASLAAARVARERQNVADARRLAAAE